MDETTWVPPTAEEAIGIWGMTRLNKRAEEWRREGRVVDPTTVQVSFDFSEGFACCGGCDPSCYCSYAESPSAQVTIRSYESPVTVEIPASDFDLATVVREVIAAAGGVVTT